MEGTLQSKWAQRRQPVSRLLLPQLSSQTGHALMTDTLLFSSLIHSQHNPTTSWVPTEGMGVPATGWAFLVVKGTCISALWHCVCLDYRLLPAHRPTPAHLWSSEEGFGAEGPPLQPVTCPSYLSLHCQLIYSNRQVGDRAGRRRMTLKCNKRRGTQGNLEACLRP